MSFLASEDVVGIGMEVLRAIESSSFPLILLYCQAFIVDAIVKFLFLGGLLLGCKYDGVKAPDGGMLLMLPDFDI